MSTGRPFKKFFCDRPEAFLLPPAAFKIWMYHYSRENADRKSWPSVETLMAKCDLGRKAVYQWRAWLQENHWLVKTGEIKGRNHGEFGVPIFTVRRGIVPHRHPKSGSRPPSPQKGDTDASPKGSLEVDSEKQVEVVPTAAVSESQMESELQVGWIYYLEAFDSEEILSPSAKKAGVAVFSRLDPSIDRVHYLTCVIDMACYIVKRDPKKAYLSQWAKLLAASDSLYKEYCNSPNIPAASELPETEAEAHQRLAKEREEQERKAREKAEWEAKREELRKTVTPGSTLWNVFGLGDNLSRRG